MPLMTTVKVDEKAKVVTIIMPIIGPKDSSTGKTIILCSTEGSYKTGVQWEGGEVILNCTAYKRK